MKLECSSLTSLCCVPCDPVAMAGSGLPESRRFVCCSVGLLRMPTDRSIERFIQDNLRGQHLNFQPRSVPAHEDIMLGSIRRESQMTSLVLNGRRLVLVDWRGFHDPESMAIKHHLGTHPSIMRKLVERPSVRESCRQMYPILREDDGVPVTLLSYCRAGRHRSYGGARILRAIIEIGKVSCDLRFLQPYSLQAWMPWLR